MRIERRGHKEYLVDCPRGAGRGHVCEAECEGWACSLHVNGEHVATMGMERDRSQEICIRWPIESGATTSPANAPPRSAEEIAREMVVDAGWLQLGASGVRLASDVSVPHARAIIAAAIERDRAERQPAQPRDLAGRIRALVQEYAGRWVDSFRHETSALRESMSLMRDVVQSGAHAESVTMVVDQLRTKDDFPERRLIFRRAADDLERIARECGEWR